MTVNQHTPGPWKPARSHEDYHGPYFDIDPEDAEVYASRPFVKIVSPSGNVTNAHDLFEFHNPADAWLIAAAPDLLVELERLVTGLEWHVATHPLITQECDHEALASAKATITKARGCAP